MHGIVPVREILVTSLLHQTVIPMRVISVTQRRVVPMRGVGMGACGVRIPMSGVIVVRVVRVRCRGPP